MRVIYEEEKQALSELSRDIQDKCKKIFSTANIEAYNYDLNQLERVMKESIVILDYIIFRHEEEQLHQGAKPERSDAREDK